jgi:hypothetical protein
MEAPITTIYLRDQDGVGLTSLRVWKYLRIA